LARARHHGRRTYFGWRSITIAGESYHPVHPIDLMQQFCTCFDSNYLFKGLALHRSLTRHVPDAVVWVLCLDKAVERVLDELSLPGLRPVPLAELEAAEPQLRAAKLTRSRVEYYFTCTPTFLWHLLTRVPDTAPLTYLDADLFFFSSPHALLAESTTGSIAILPHRFPPELQRLEKYGTYNVSWLTFLDDRAARECLAWWRNRCIEWCYDRLEDGKFADQKYLDEWPTRFQGVHVLRHQGAGVAPWNVAAQPISRGPDGPRVGNAPLVFYHFHAFRRVLKWLFDPGLARYGARMTPMLKEAVYLPYLAELRAIEHELRRTVSKVPPGWGSARRLGLRGLIQQALRRQLLVAPERGD
jgi:hypothetical protein